MDKINQLIFIGKKQRYLLFEEIDKTFQGVLYSGKDFDDFLSSLDDYGIKIRYKRMGDTPKRKRSDLFSLESLERTNDPVKLYLRDMGHISLLTRKGEIAIAKQIERSYKNIIKALLKSRLLQNHIFSYWEEKIRDLNSRLERIPKNKRNKNAGEKISERDRTQLFRVTRERIRQIEAKAVRKLRHPCRSHKLKSFVDVNVDKD